MKLFVSFLIALLIASAAAAFGAGFIYLFDHYQNAAIGLALVMIVGCIWALIYNKMP